jgi:ribosomal-protein-alanine N-acetyltransferase
MSLLSPFSRPSLYRRYDGKAIYIRPPQSNDWLAWAELRTESREFLEPWEPTWPHSALSRATYRRRLQRYARDGRDDEGYAFLIFRQADDVLVGGVNMSNVARGIRLSCSLGYWIGERYARQGYMTGAVRVTLQFAFDQLRLHRVEAGCVPTNFASRDLLRKVGFTEEGYARKYLSINGAWHDHLLFAMVSDDFRA